MLIIRKYINEANKYEFFLLISLIYILISILLNEYIIKEDLYYQTLGEHLARERIEEFLEFKNKWDWVGYCIIPVVLLIKIFYVTVCFEIGVIFHGFKVSFRNLFHVAMLSESIFLFAQILKAIAFLFSKPETLYEVQSVSTLSLYSIINGAAIDPWFIYPLQTMNVFEIIYWFFLAYVLKILLEKEYGRMVRFVLSTYGIGLLAWIILVMFINVNYG